LQIVASSYAAAAYLSSIGFGKTLMPGKRALVFGSQGMVDELELVGIPFITGEQLQLPSLPDPDSMKRIQVLDTIILLRRMSLRCCPHVHGRKRIADPAWPLMVGRLMSVN
jgi:hypothetical protein